MRLSTGIALYVVALFAAGINAIFDLAGEITNLLVIVGAAAAATFAIAELDTELTPAKQDRLKKVAALVALIAAGAATGAALEKGAPETVAGAVVGVMAFAYLYFRDA